jgi:TPR repeat protein
MKLRVITFFASGVFASALFGAAMAGPLEDARAAIDRGDFPAAARIVRPLAEHGDPDAQKSLGTMYELGLGVPQDYVLAHMWFNLVAAQAVDEKDRPLRQLAAESRDRVAAKMTPAQIAKAQRLAREWKPTR